jgi:hypothetical protein
MPSHANDAHRLIVSSEIIALAVNPLIGELTLTTDKGDFVFALNQEAAESLSEELISFLDTE